MPREMMDVFDSAAEGLVDDFENQILQRSLAVLANEGIDLEPLRLSQAKDRLSEVVREARGGKATLIQQGHSGDPVVVLSAESLLRLMSATQLKTPRKTFGDLFESMKSEWGETHAGHSIGRLNRSEPFQHRPLKLTVEELTHAVSPGRRGAA